MGVNNTDTFQELWSHMFIVRNRLNAPYVIMSYTLTIVQQFWWFNTLYKSTSVKLSKVYCINVSFGAKDKYLFFLIKSWQGVKYGSLWTIIVLLVKYCFYLRADFTKLCGLTFGAMQSGFPRNFWLDRRRDHKSLCPWGSGLITKKPTKNLMTQFLNKIFSKKLKTRTWLLKKYC